MNLAITFILIALVIWISILIRNLIFAIKGFTLLIDKFIEVNQEFYEGQKSIVKKDKEVFENMSKQMAEVGIIRKYSNQISIVLKNVGEVTKSLVNTQREVKVATEELIVSKDIANSLATVSNNIKLLDKVAIDLRSEINDLKRRK